MFLGTVRTILKTKKFLKNYGICPIQLPMKGSKWCIYLKKETVKICKFHFLFLSRDGYDPIETSSIYILHRSSNSIDSSHSARQTCAIPTRILEFTLPCHRFSFEISITIFEYI